MLKFVFREQTKCPAVYVKQTSVFYLRISRMLFCVGRFMERFFHETFVNIHYYLAQAKAYRRTGSHFYVTHKIYTRSCANPIKINKEIKIKIHVN